MTTLAPYIVAIPEKWKSDPEIKAWAEYDNRWKADLNVVLNFGNAITNITNSESFETSSTSAEYQEHRRVLEQTEDLIPVTRLKQFRPTVQSVNYSAVDEDFVDAQNGSTITLMPSAGAEIITANGDGTWIKLYSTIEFHHNGQVSNWVDMLRQDTSLHWFLFESGTKQYWRAS